MAYFGSVTAEIGSVVWGTPANFNGFRFLAELLHGALVVGITQTLRSNGVEQRAPPIFGEAAITLGIDPYSSYLCFDDDTSEAERASGLFHRSRFHRLPEVLSWNRWRTRGVTDDSASPGKTTVKCK